MSHPPQCPWGSLPVHLQTLGVSDTTLSAARYQPDVPKSSKLAEIKKNITKTFVKNAAAGTTGASRSSSHTPHRHNIPLHLMPVELQGRPVSTNTLFRQIQQNHAGRSSQSACASPPRGALHSMPSTGSFGPPEPPLHELDFQAMADSSVGGSGLPRPYGRFIGHKAGDGKAVFERRPTSRAASWHAKVFGLPDPSMEQKRGRMPKTYASSSSVEASPSKRSTSRGTCPVMQDLSFHGSGPQSDSEAHPNGSRFWRPSGSRTAAADPIAPSSCHSRFALPAATFLASAPLLPTNLRVDCGDGAAKELLRSAQSPPRPRPPPFSELSKSTGELGKSTVVLVGDHRPATVSFHSNRWTDRGQTALGAPAPVLTTAPQAGPALGCFDSCPPHNPLDGTPIVGEALPTPPSREDPGGSPGQQGPDLPGYRRQRGLYFPVNQVADDSVRTSLGLHDNAPVPHTTEVLTALAETHRLRFLSPLHSSAPVLYTSHPRNHFHSARQPLPVEEKLPRRFVPWRGR